MKLENQVCSLELSKKLKELGFKNNNLFYWSDSEDGEWCLCLNWKNSQENDPIVYISRELEENEDGGYYPAYTVAELGEMLPNKINNEFPNSWVSGKDENYFCSYETADHSLHDEFSNTEADARAKMLIYLKENKLI